MVKFWPRRVNRLLLVRLLDDKGREKCEMSDRKDLRVDGVF